VLLFVPAFFLGGLALAARRIFDEADRELLALEFT
jgi:hypothetical protein